MRGLMENGGNALFQTKGEESPFLKRFFMKKGSSQQGFTGEELSLLKRLTNGDNCKFVKENKCSCAECRLIRRYLKESGKFRGTNGACGCG